MNGLASLSSAETAGMAAAPWALRRMKPEARTLTAGLFSAAI